jgi:hypothetical protein
VAGFALPVNFQDAELYTESVAVVDDVTSGFGTFFNFYRTTGNKWWRPRFVNVFGQSGGTVGDITVSLVAASTPTSPSPWFQGTIFTAPAQPVVPVTKSWTFTWSADIGDNYSGATGPFDVAGVMGMPLVFIPENCIMQLQFHPSVGGDGVSDIQGGIMQIEVVPLPGAAASGPHSNADLYLLPALG